MTLKNFEYISYLFTNFYSSISTLNSRIIPNPNPNTGKPIIGYKFLTKSLPTLTALHSIWYIWSTDLNKFVKIVPLNIASFLTPLALALWLQDDSYWYDKTVWICTDCFTEIEVKLLISALISNLGIIARISRRKKADGSFFYRIRISGKKENIDKLKSLVIPFFCFISFI